MRSMPVSGGRISIWLDPDLTRRVFRAMSRLAFEIGSAAG
jgi:hypothetical protein